MGNPAYSELLRAEMRRQGITNRALGKLTDPDNPEVGRRRVQRHLGGKQPTDASKNTYARVLNATQLAASDDDEEDHPVTRLRRMRRELREVERDLERSPR